MKKIALFLMLTLPLLAFAQGKVFQHVDEQGNVTFSDQPSQGAEVIKVDPVQTFSAPTSNTPEELAPEKKIATAESYTSIKMLKPQPDETLWNNPGNMTVDIELIPPLRAGDKIIVKLDGNPIQESTKNTTFQLTNIERGEHTVSAEVLDANGNSLLSTPATTFFLHQASTNMPSRRR